jgi:hypothetical protein
VPSEDPFLAGEYATGYVRGCQEGSDPRYLKMSAGLKHYTAYSVENNRGAFNGIISTFDLFDTYLPQYERGFVDGRATNVMCSYASINGVPSCANPLLTMLVRERWDRPDVVQVRRCMLAGVQNEREVRRDMRRREEGGGRREETRRGEETKGEVERRRGETRGDERREEETRREERRGEVERRREEARVRESPRCG